MTKSRNLLRRKREMHGKCHSPEYKVWRDIYKRCCNKNFKQFDDYGGRGISVCLEWRDSFSCFYKDMGDRLSPSHSIERIDNEKGYFKENCRWVIRSIQLVNQRRRKRSDQSLPLGVRARGNKYCSRIVVNKKEYHLGMFGSAEEATKAFNIVFLEWYGFPSPKNIKQEGRNE